MTLPRTAVLRAADAPAPSIVVDFSSTSQVQSRDDVREYLADVRQALMGSSSGIEGLGIKNIAVFEPREDVVRVEFFQGFEYGPLTPNSQQFCLNSLALMGGLSFRLRPSAR